MTNALQQPGSWQRGGSQGFLDADELDKKDWPELQRCALLHYEKSLDANTRSEHTIAHRGWAKNYASSLLRNDATRGTALNLLARIALDEGFYRLADHFLTDALKLDAEDAGCWYSMGHVRLATKDYDSALECFSRSQTLAPNETRAATSRAYTLARQGRLVDAFQAYRGLFRIYPHDQHIQAKLFELVKNIRADSYQPDLETDLISCLEIDSADHQALAPLTMSLMKCKYALSNADMSVNLEDLTSDRLLNLALGRLYFTDPEIEKFITLLRKQVLLNCISGTYQDQELLELAGRLAMHAVHNEQLYLYDQDETDLIIGLRNLLSNTLRSKTQPGCAHLITLYAMYEPLMALPGIERLNGLDVTGWPTYAQVLVQQVVVNATEEVRLMASIEQLSSIADGLPQSAQSDNDASPYPRWLHLDYNTPTNFGRALESELIGFRAPDFFNMGTIKFLIAGASTGQYALKVAGYFRNAEVLAIDLNNRSLAYAKRMAEQHQISNIRFLNCDILELDQLDEQFHVIECSGVLHHMKNPEQGLAALKARLAPKGLLKLGLYSYQARATVRQMRQLIEHYDVPATTDGIRTLRQTVLDGKVPGNFGGLLSSQDFYSLSGCRELLFHSREFQYEPLELKAMIDRHGLKFLGFVLPESVRKDYSQRFPDDPRMVDLSHWQAFEQDHPALFAGMFQFYLQPDG
ncbi:methyltransferase domain-containing protein [Reinekea sp.]|uniref:methyltransferase domain-containing protein n=1 Tax=Reinekea sp. TaxID=1970455 RepID=UPI00257BA3F9|nr:methyltransferase domain-containing protein [Reinekea sp.]